MTALIGPAELASALDRGEVRALDVQYSLVGTPGAELYAAGHLPRAPHLGLDSALAGRPGRWGRHPLPDPGVLQEALRACGVNDDTAVVVYDQATSLSAARAWWVLQWAGHPDVRVLDGGLARWRRAGLPVTRETAVVDRGDITVRPGSVPVLDAGAAAAMTRTGVLLDVRTEERYRGDSEPIDNVAGHIPGSVNLPMALAQREDGTFRSPAEIRELAASVGAHRGLPVGTSCGSGVTAALMSLALAEAGIESIPYVGSWSEWIEDPARPVALGDAP